MQDKEFGSIVMTCKEGERIMLGDSAITLVKIGGNGVGKAIKIHIKADKSIPVSRVKKEKKHDV
jgi:sRNA-binding carbon storage regulator CsrA